MTAALVTVAETPLFVRQARTIWEDDERLEFVTYIAANPEAGDLIPQTGGVRKVRWSRSGRSRAAASGWFIFTMTPSGLCTS